MDGELAAILLCSTFVGVEWVLDTSPGVKGISVWMTLFLSLLRGVSTRFCSSDILAGCLVAAGLSRSTLNACTKLNMSRNGMRVTVAALVHTH